MARGLIDIKVILPGGSIIPGKFRRREIEKIVQAFHSKSASKITYKKESFWSRFKFWKKKTHA